MPYIELLAQYLRDNDFTDIFTHTMPPEGGGIPMKVICIYEAQHGAPYGPRDIDIGWRVKRFQIRTRDRTPNDAYETLWRIHDLLNSGADDRNILISMEYWSTGIPNEPYHLDTDEKGRFIFSMNLRIKTNGR